MRPLLLFVTTAAILAVGGAVLTLPSDDVIREAEGEESETTARLPPVETAVFETTTTTTTTTTTSTTTTTIDPNVVVPSILGLDFVAARRVMMDAGLEAVRVEAPVALIEQIGTAIDQVPAPGENSIRGNTAEIVMGIRPVPVTEVSPEIPWEQIEFIDVNPTLLGECSNGRLSEGGLVLDTVDCATAHDFQFGGQVEIAAPNAYDGDQVADQLWDQCQTVFASFVGTSFDESVLAMQTVSPHPDSWSAGERTGDCFLAAPSGTRIIGSAQGSLW